MPSRGSGHGADRSGRRRYGRLRYSDDSPVASGPRRNQGCLAAAMNTVAPRTNLPSLTSLRFFAAFGVLITHVGGMSLSPAVREATSAGHVGVSFFFMLSGFVLTWSRQPEIGAVQFYRRRVARIYPLHVATWAIALTLAIAMTGRPPWREIAMPLTLLHSWSPNLSIVFGVNAPSWSLSDEAFFYLMFPLLVGAPMMSRRNAARTWGACAAASIVAWPIVAAVIGGAAGDSSGVVLARMVESGSRCPLRVWHSVLLVSAAVAVVPFAPRHAQPVAVTFIPFAALIWSAACADMDGRTPRLLGGRTLFALGRWSFALYLIHNILVTAWLHVTGRLPWLHLVVAGAVVAVLSVAASAVLYRWVEIPAQRALRGVPKDLRASVVVAQHHDVADADPLLRVTLPAVRD